MREMSAQQREKERRLHVKKLRRMYQLALSNTASAKRFLEFMFFLERQRRNDEVAVSFYVILLGKRWQLDWWIEHFLHHTLILSTFAELWTIT